MATIKDVARKAGVSMSTVSKYMNGGNLRAENAAAIPCQQVLGSYLVAFDRP